MADSSWLPIRTLRPSTWNDTGTCQIPLLAPAFRVFGGPPPKVWASTFRSNGWRVDMLDDRWALDITETRIGSVPAVGDAIVWVGDGVDETGVGPCAWPPSRITRVEPHPTQSRIRIWSLRDTWHTAIDLGEAMSESVHIPWHDVKSAVGPIAIDRAVLQWWTLDVWCPACGALGRAVSWGMVPPPGMPEPPLSAPWEDITAELGGCLKPTTPSAMHCSRCDTSWGDSALTSTWWPDNPQVAYEPPIRTIPQLLEVLDCTSPAEFQALIENELEADSARLHVSAQGIGVELDFESFSLDFPFTQSELWQAVSDAEGRSLMRRACHFLQSEIQAVEGFEIALFPGAYLDNGNWPRVGWPELPDYPYRKAAPGTWTYEQWLERRLLRVLPGATDETFDVEAFCPDAQSEVDTLSELRQRNNARNDN